MLSPWHLAMYANICAANARIEGMKAENEVRSNQGLSPAYGEKAFQEEAQELVNLGEHIRNS